MEKKHANKKIEKLKKGGVPKHLAIILDGNGRWARKRGMPRTYGHQVGANNILKIARLADSLGIKYLTLYAFSTENWSRPKEEVDYLMKLPFELYERNKKTLLSDEHNIVIKQVGRRSKFSKELNELFDKFYNETKHHTGLTLNLAFDYGSSVEIDEAIKKMIKDQKDSFLIEDVLPYLYVKEPVDFLIRTSGEQRLSNFLLLQCSYAEFYFTKKHWPAFNKQELIKAIKEYQKRERRFGGLKR
ncbi:MAG TPA: di-trans,poly-cis-decaprenylcistransferase [Acholeplasma sp.]|jgi:undecaprenyl diphosphate synthase|nr:polyprenyl diphosphate synthase [Acholeplasmatales bacterium]HHV33325.1 di-trans,poly-cis-decaprenylcistransferase [Acholeplasma sp.]